MKQYYIYLTTNKINGKKYIGQHYGELEDKYLGSGVILNRAILKYGKENFEREILEIATEETINEREKYYIKLYDAAFSDDFYNIAFGGNTPNFIELNKAKEKWQQEHPEEHKNQIDEWRAAGSKANSKRILCVTTGEEFESMCAAARHYNIPQPNISKCCRGKRAHAGRHPETKEKMVWRYL